MSKLTIVIPTRNEVQSLPQVITRLIKALDGSDYQILVVDDGNDNTPEILGQMANQQVEFYRRPVIERNGLSGAVIAGIKRANGKYVAVMDGDGQHPSELIRRMLWIVKTRGLDMIMASRYIDGGEADGLENGMRKFYSTFLRQMPRLLFPKLKKVTDPLGGCFMVRMDCLHPTALKAIGWKISLEILLFSDIQHYQEIGYSFCERIGGDSKANLRVGLDYFHQLFSLVLRYYRFSKSFN